MANKKTRYVCQSCGAIQPRWLGRCPSCGEWNTYVEELAPSSRKNRISSRDDQAPISFAEIDIDRVERQTTGMPDLDRILGGGIVPGATLLFGGEPGVGKSTLLLQVASSLASLGKGVLYVSAEESPGQIRMRGDRIAIASQDFQVLGENLVENSIAWADKLKPSMVIVDSIQACKSSNLESSPGTVSQVREVTAAWNEWAKQNDSTVALVGHVTKEGSIAGPKVVEHMVDTVLLFEGDSGGEIRLLRGLKNRFGATGELCVLEMRSNGLHSVTNPSRMFLNERDRPVSGVAVSCIVKGSRPLLVEVQSLVSRSFYTTPQRNATGIEHRRLAMLLAVLEKRIGLNLGSQDVFLNVAGNLRLEDPASDLAAATAVYASLADKAVTPGTVLIGEIGLTGEVRSVTSLERRIAEAEHLGFQQAIVPVTGEDLNGTAMIIHRTSTLSEALKQAVEHA